MGHHVFISYSRKDQAYARKLAKDLRANGIEPWNDEDIEHGAPWWPTIVEAIHACTAFVVVMTTESDVSEWVLKEIMLAHREEKLILPLLLSGKGHTYLIDRQHEDMTGGRMPPKAFYDRLRRTLSTPEPVAEPPVERPPARKRRSRAGPTSIAGVKSARGGFGGSTSGALVRRMDEPELVHIPAGPFLMGSNNSTKDEQPQHTVELSAYWIGKYPVTNARYQAFVRNAGHRSPGHWDGDAYPDGKGDHPVVHVSWEDATTYCKWLSKETGKEYRLPTEAQWEKAARGEDGRIYPWGNEWNASRLNSREGSRDDTSPVGQFSPKGDSPYDVADMAGNVWEWCADWYGEAEYKRRADSALKDPEGPEKGGFRVLRGGSFRLNRPYARCTIRRRFVPNLRRSGLGFRLVLLP